MAASLRYDAPMENFGLYLHIPYCKAVCHYCDFAKTANFQADHGRRYLARLAEHLRAWLQLLPSLPAGIAVRPPFTSVFLGGGTPSLFADEYEPLFALIRDHLAPGAEVSLEANPDDVTPERLRRWRQLGVNRLSLGVQTFEARGLASLKRVHDAEAARRAATAARQVFDSINIDLIYGWDRQEASGFAADIKQALALGATHLSLYTLTYEVRTPLGRAMHRGLTQPTPDDQLAGMYELACEQLGAAGFVHEEVSNWALPGHACRHNWGYWQEQPYLGLGAGAHGYLRGKDQDQVKPEAGLRYEYPRSDRTFLRHDLSLPPQPRASTELAALTAGLGIALESDRRLDTWLVDYVGSALRTRRGLDLVRVRAQTGRELRLTPLLAEAVERRIISIDDKRDDQRRAPGDGGGSPSQLRLAPAEWFRETAWGVEILRGFEA